MDIATWNKPSVIPLAEDVLRLKYIQKYKYIKKEQLELYSQLKSKNATVTFYRSLEEVILVHLITFNRKLVGEVEQLEKSAYLNRAAETPLGKIEKV